MRPASVAMAEAASASKAQACGVRRPRAAVGIGSVLGAVAASGLVAHIAEPGVKGGEEARTP